MNAERIKFLLLSEKPTSKLIHSSSSGMKEEVDFIKRLIRITSNSDGLEDDSIFKVFLEEEHIPVIRLVHNSGEGFTRIVVDLKGDPLFIDLPLWIDDEEVTDKGVVEFDTDLVMHYRGETHILELLNDDVVPEHDESTLYYLHSGYSNVTSSVNTELSPRSGEYAQQKLLELIETDPRFAVDVLLSTGDFVGAIEQIQESGLPLIDFKKEICFAVADSRHSGSIVALNKNESDISLPTGLLDALTLNEIDILFTEALAQENVWNGTNIHKRVQLVAAESSPKNIERLMSSLALLTPIPVPDDLDSWLKAEIAGSHIKADSVTPKKRLKL